MHTSRRFTSLFLVVLAVAVARGDDSGDREPLRALRDVSGVHVRGNDLYLVGNRTPGIILKLDKALLGAVADSNDGKLVQLGPTEDAKVIQLEGRAEDGIDLEDIAWAAGQVAVVSEASATVSTPTRAVLRYHVGWIDRAPDGHVGKPDATEARAPTRSRVERGIEGLAIRPHEGASVVAVLCERAMRGAGPGPSLGVHATRYALGDASITLVNLPERAVDLGRLRASAKLPPDAPLRGTALVWYRWRKVTDADTSTDRSGRWGLVVLISEPSDTRRKWLLRVDEDGQLRDSPKHAFVRLKSLLDCDEDEVHNWEGMCWLDTGAKRKRLVLVADNGKPDAVTPAVVVQIPKAWQ